MNQPIRILFILGRGGFGGIERHVQSLIRNLDRKRFEPRVIVLFEDGVIAEELRADGVAVQTLHGRSGHQISLIWKLHHAIKEANPELIHAHELHAVVGLCMRLRYPLPWIQTEHITFEHGPSPDRARMLWRLFQGRMSAVLAVSTETGRSLARNTGLDPAKIVVIFNGVDLSRLPPKDPDYLKKELGFSSEVQLIGSVGRLATGKGWEDFVETAQKLFILRPDCRFVVIGDGAERENLQRLASRTTCAERFHFLGSRPDALALLGSLDLFLFCSEYEAMPTTLLEAFAMRVPVAGFVSDGGVREILELTGQPAAKFLNQRNTSELAEMSAALLEGKDESSATIQTARDLVESRFSMASLTRELEQQYLKVLTRKENL